MAMDTVIEHLSDDIHVSDIRYHRYQTPQTP